MKVALGSDHAGFELKEHLVAKLLKDGYEVINVGTYSTESTDYPIYGEAAARKVADGEADRAIVVCGTGQGIGISANKVPGIRCAIVTEAFSARLSRQHNNANALALGSRVIGTDVADDIVDVWLNAEFFGGRHERRVDEIGQIETHC
jgi:ribose 5-phosphate isomerase B